MEASCAGVAPTLIADGGRVPCAGDSEPNDDRVKSPKPLVSPSCATPIGESVDAGFEAEEDICLADVLVLRTRFDTCDDGVWFSVASIDPAPVAGSTPVIIKSASSTGSGVFCRGMRRWVRVDFDFVTKPSLSSLKLLMASTVLVVIAVARFAVVLGCFATTLGGAAFATRVVVDVILVRFGRGIVKANGRVLLEV